jgi:hypothetical protein
MPTQLTELEVEWVSLVDRAAVRDPSEPSEPQRFLLAKSDIPIWKADPGSEMDQLLDALAKAESDRDAALEKTAGTYERLAERVEKLEINKNAAGVTSADLRKGSDEMSTSDATSDAVGAATQAGQNVSSGAQAAIGRAVEEISPYAGEDPRVEALVTKLLAIADPVGGGEGQLAKAMSTVLKMEREIGTDRSTLSSDHSLIAKASKRIQAQYLAEQSPAAYEAWKSRGETVGVSKAQASLANVVAEIRECDPSVSKYDAMVRATHENPALAKAYKDSVS